MYEFNSLVGIIFLLYGTIGVTLVCLIIGHYQRIKKTITWYNKTLAIIIHIGSVGIIWKGLKSLFIEHSSILDNIIYDLAILQPISFIILIIINWNILIKK